MVSYALSGRPIFTLRNACERGKRKPNGQPPAGVSGCSMVAFRQRSLQPSRGKKRNKNKNQRFGARRSLVSAYFCTCFVMLNLKEMTRADSDRNCRWRRRTAILVLPLCLSRVNLESYLVKNKYKHSVRSQQTRQMQTFT